MKETFKKINEFHLVVYYSISAIYESYGSTLPKFLEKQLASVVYSIGQYIDDNPDNYDVVTDDYYRRFVLNEDCNDNDK